MGIKHLNMKIPPLVMSIQDEAQAMPVCIAKVQEQDPTLGAKLMQQWELCKVVNDHHPTHIAQITQLPGFSASYLYRTHTGGTL